MIMMPLIHMKLEESFSSLISSEKSRHRQYIVVHPFIFWFILQGIHHDHHNMPSLLIGEMYSFLITMLLLNFGRSTTFYNIGGPIMASFLLKISQLSS